MAYDPTLLTSVVLYVTLLDSLSVPLLSSSSFFKSDLVSISFLLPDSKSGSFKATLRVQKPGFGGEGSGFLSLPKYIIRIYIWNLYARGCTLSIPEDASCRKKNWGVGRGREEEVRQTGRAFSHHQVRLFKSCRGN